MKKTLLARFNIILVALVATSLACNLPSRRTEASPTPIPVTTEAAQSLQEDLQEAARALQAGEPVSLEIDEAELTSLVALELQKQENPPFQNPQISLQDGRIRITGQAKQADINVPVEAVILVVVDANGSLVYNLESAKIGVLPLPQAMVDEMTQQMDQAFDQILSSSMAEVSIQSLTIANGVMTIQGVTRAP